MIMNDRLYDVTIEFLGMKKKDTFKNAAICLGKEGEFMVMDATGSRLSFMAECCKVEQIAAHVIIIKGFTQGLKPKHITAYCVYIKGAKITEETC